MKKILLASHGEMAVGLKNTVEFFLGNTNMVKAVSAYLDESDNYIREIQTFISEAIEGDAIIFTDIYGGSVNQLVVKMITESNKKIPIVSSMNLPIVLSIAMSEEKWTDELIKELLEECKPIIVEVCLQEENEGDIDDFLS